MIDSNLTLGSLFSGSGGFELAGALFGIEPLWESEVEPLPIRVTERNFPNCLKLGNIVTIHGWSIPKVDIITGGSPCQDMSIAGKRDGLSGDRSCLFNEQIRIVKEMREDDRNAGRTGTDIRPRWMCWENVPGAFTSNKRQDFQAVLTEIIRIAAPEAPPVPIPKKGWPYAGCFMGEHGEWSVAYRTLDAQFWGVPQRRSRIYLVADFAGSSAPEILLERNGMSRNFTESRQAWETDHPHPEIRLGEASRDNGGQLGTAYSLLIRSGCEGGGKGALMQTEQSATLSTHNNQTLFDPAGTMVLDNHPQDSRISIREDGMAPTLTEKMGTGGNNVPMVMEPAIAFDCRNITPNIEVAPTLQAKENGGQSLNYIAPVFTPIPISDKATRYQGGGKGRHEDGGGNGLGIGQPGDPAPCITAGERHGVAYGISRSFFNQGENAKYDPEITEEVSTTITTAHCPPGVAMPLTAPEISGTLTAKMAKGTGGPAGDEMQNLVAEWPEYIIRRFTPMECCRLQGFPDWWAEQLGVEEPPDGMVDRWMEIFKTHWEVITQHDGVKAPKTRSQVIKWLKDPASDSALYKMWGNGIALPCAAFVMEGIANHQTERNDANGERVQR